MNLPLPSCAWLLAFAAAGACAQSSAPVHLTPQQIEHLAATDLLARAAVPRRFLIEREIPGASKTPPEEFRAGAAKSNAVLRELGADIQWVTSYVAGDKVYCIYQATSEALIREHAAKSGFPANKITPIVAVLDPTTAR